MAERVGQQLGNYRLIHLLGHGGFADVYLGEHVYLKTLAAIKVLGIQLTEDMISSFLVEAQIIAQLAHPHIVRLLDFGVENMFPFLVMDYAPNGTLRQRHPRGMSLPLPLIVSYVKQIAGALQYAHDRRLVHRDVKPENMLLGHNHEVLLSDFGIAVVTQTSHQQPSQEVVGTAAYMAPEQLQGKPRPASDQYALGIVIYEWLTGDLPFHGTLAFTEVASQHLFVSPPSLHAKVPTIPPLVEEVVMIALAKDPKQRFGSVQAFANAFEQASSLVDFSTSGLAPLFPTSGASAPSGTPTLISPPLIAGVPPVSMPQPRYYSEAEGTSAHIDTPPRMSPPLVAGVPPVEYTDHTLTGLVASVPVQRSGKPGLSSLFRAAGNALEKVLSGVGGRRAQETQLSLFAIAHATLENDDRALVGRTYSVQAGISQSKPENFRGEPFELSVRNPVTPLLFDILIHASDNIQLKADWYQRLTYYPLNSAPQLVQFIFQVVAPGQSSVAIDFYHERRWLRTIRLEFNAIEQSQFSTVTSGV